VVPSRSASASAPASPTALCCSSTRSICTTQRRRCPNPSDAFSLLPLRAAERRRPATQRHAELRPAGAAQHSTAKLPVVVVCLFSAAATVGGADARASSPHRRSQLAARLHD
jgi:hypothetical protein